MAWRLKGKPKTLKATKALAQEWAAMPQIRQDRELKERRLYVYQQMYNEGEFRPVLWASCYCKETGETYRVNGWHTSTLLCRQNPFPTDFFVVIEEYEADTLEDVANLWSTFDSKMQTRNQSDINNSFARSDPDLCKIPIKTINLIVAGLGFADDLEHYALKAPVDRAERMLDHVDFAQWVDAIFRTEGTTDQETRFLQRMPVVACMFKCFTKSKKDASKFWELVRDQNGVDPKSADRTLAKWLMTCLIDPRKEREGHEPKRLARRAGPREFFVRCIHGWNAWREDRTTNLRYEPGAAIPAVV